MGMVGSKWKNRQKKVASHSTMEALHLFYVLEVPRDFVGNKRREEKGFCYFKIFFNCCFNTKTLVYNGEFHPLQQTRWESL